MSGDIFILFLHTHTHKHFFHFIFARMCVCARVSVYVCPAVGQQELVKHFMRLVFHKFHSDTTQTRSV